jgi:hypothetical protein
MRLGFLSWRTGAAQAHFIVAERFYIILRGMSNLIRNKTMTSRNRTRFLAAAVVVAVLLLESCALLNETVAVLALALLRGFQEKKLPAEITLDVLVRNPNDGTGGSTKTVSTLTGLESRLLINGNPTVFGNIDSPMEIPGTGQASTVPIRFSIDLYEFFGSQGYEGLIDTALVLGGSKASAARIALDAQPTVTTPFGIITYPGRITIVDKEFR